MLIIPNHQVTILQTNNMIIRIQNLLESHLLYRGRSREVDSQYAGRRKYHAGLHTRVWPQKIFVYRGGEMQEQVSYTL